MRDTARSRASRRLVAATGVVAGAVALTLAVHPGGGTGPAQADGFKLAYAARAANATAKASGDGSTIYLPDGTHVHTGGSSDGHDHNDPRTKPRSPPSRPPTRPPRGRPSSTRRRRPSSAPRPSPRSPTSR
jgi:hypothetical protein